MKKIYLELFFELEKKIYLELFFELEKKLKFKVRKQSSGGQENPEELLKIKNIEPIKNV